MQTIEFWRDYLRGTWSRSRDVGVWVGEKSFTSKGVTVLSGWPRGNCDNGIITEVVVG